MKRQHTHPDLRVLSGNTQYVKRRNAEQIWYRLMATLMRGWRRPT